MGKKDVSCNAWSLATHFVLTTVMRSWVSNSVLHTAMAGSADHPPTLFCVYTCAVKKPSKFWREVYQRTQCKLRKKENKRLRLLNLAWKAKYASWKIIQSHVKNEVCRIHIWFRFWILRKDCVVLTNSPFAGSPLIWWFYWCRVAVMMKPTQTMRLCNRGSFKAPIHASVAVVPVTYHA